MNFVLQGIPHQNNQPLNKQILALKYFLEKFKCSKKRVEFFDIIFPKLNESLREVGCKFQMIVLYCYIYFYNF